MINNVDTGIPKFVLMHRIYGTGKKGGGGGGGAFLNFDGRQFHAALHNFSGQTRFCAREGLSFHAKAVRVRLPIKI